MKTLILCVLISLPLAALADDVDDLREGVRNGSIPLDHAARIGDFEYEIFVNRAVAPPLATARITSESMDRLFATPEKTIASRMAAQHWLVKKYLSELTGRPIHPMSVQRRSEERGTP